MRADLQQRISPYSAQSSHEFNQLDVNDRTAPTPGSDSADTKINFKDLLMNSNEAKAEERLADKNKDLSSLSETDFLKKMQEDSKPVRKAKNTMDKDDFLKLFVAQLKNQDPLNPDKGDEMAAKLAQFNSLEQQMNSNKSLTELIAAQKKDQSLQMLNYVGKEVKLDGGFIKIKDGGVVAQTFEAPIDVATATLVVRNLNGAKQAEIDMGGFKRGTIPINWDGKTSTGKQLPSGVYKYSIEAKSVTNQKVDIPLTTQALITGIDLKDAEKGLYTEYGQVSINDIKAVGTQGFGDVKAALTESMPPDTKSVVAATNATTPLDGEPAVSEDQTAIQNTANRGSELQDPASESTQLLPQNQTLQPPQPPDVKSVTQRIPPQYLQSQSF